MPRQAVILIADDDDSICECWKMIFEMKGYQVHCAFNGKEAVRMAQTHLPDLILLDLYMPPGVNGAEAFLLLRQDSRTKDIPVIIVSGRDKPGEDILQTFARATGCSDYYYKTENKICKTVAPTILLQKMRDVLDADQHRRQMAVETTPSHNEAEGSIGHGPQNPHKSLGPLGTKIRGPLRVHYDLQKVSLNCAGGNFFRQLPDKPFEVFVILFETPGPLLRQDILSSVWGDGHDLRVVDQNVKRLREALDPYGEKLVHTVSHGYQFCDNLEICLGLTNGSSS